MTLQRDANRPLRSAGDSDERGLTVGAVVALCLLAGGAGFGFWAAARALGNVLTHTGSSVVEGAPRERWAQIPPAEQLRLMQTWEVVRERTQIDEELRLVREYLRLPDQRRQELRELYAQFDRLMNLKPPQERRDLRSLPPASRAAILYREIEAALRDRPNSP
jgi:hypothetical protein